MRKTLILFIFALLCTWITSFHLGKRTTSLYLNRRQEAAGAAEKKVEEKKPEEKKEEKKEDKPEEKKLEEKKPEEKKPEEKKPEEKKPEEKKEDKPEEKKPEEKKPEEKKPEEKKPEEKKPEEKKPEEKKPEEKKPEEKKDEKKPEEKKEETGGLDMKLLAEAFHLTRDCCEKCYQRNICIPAGFCVDHNGRCLTPAVVNCLAARSGCTEHCMRAFFKQDLPLLKELIASDYNGGKLKPVECQVGKEKDS